MAVYAIISLLLAIFGATHVSVNGLKAHFEGRFAGATKKAKDLAEEVMADLPKNESTWIDCNHRLNRVIFCERIWKASSAIPTILFTTVIFSISYGLIYFWNNIPDLCNSGHPKTWAALCLFLTIFTDINFGLILLLFYLLAKVKACRDRIHQIKTISDQARKQLLNSIEKANGSIKPPSTE